MPVKVSVIVCTYNRASIITACLDSIADAIAAALPVNAEIIVVDNASTDGTAAIVQAWANKSALLVQLVSEVRKGLANARNSGIKASYGDLLVFTDDDCRLSKAYVADLLRYDAADKSPVLRGGRVELGDPTDLPLTVKTVDNIERFKRSERTAARDNIGNCILGCNIAMRRSIVECLGPFDWRFSTKAVPAGEDVDYVQRAYLAGLTVEYVPDMVVFHYHGRKDKAQGYALFKKYMFGVGAMYVKYAFSDIDLLKPFWWDIKNSFKEIKGRRNLCFPAFGFWHLHKIFYCVSGAFQFILQNLFCLLKI